MGLNPNPKQNKQKRHFFLLYILRNAEEFVLLHHENPQASLQCSNRGSFFLSLHMSALFPKKYNSPEELVALLVQRGLAIDDINIASQYIRNIGYYRLSAYLYPLLDMPKEKQQFKSNSHFNKALELYRFDKKLRLFLFNEIEKIEVSFRSNLANMVAEETGNMFWITDSSLFANTNKYNKTLELKRNAYDNDKTNLKLTDISKWFHHAGICACSCRSSSFSG